MIASLISHCLYVCYSSGQILIRDSNLECMLIKFKPKFENSNFVQHPYCRKHVFCQSSYVLVSIAAKSQSIIACCRNLDGPVKTVTSSSAMRTVSVSAVDCQLQLFFVHKIIYCTVSK